MRWHHQPASHPHTPISRTKTMREHQTMKSLGSTLNLIQADSECPIHGKFTGLIVGGKPQCPKCAEEAVARDKVATTKEVEQRRRLAWAKSVVYHSGIPPRFRSKTFDG